jgi:hypothetical protein
MTQAILDRRIPVNKNLLVAYEGGGYDGCFWEWNYTYIGNNGHAEIIVSSGALGMKNIGSAADVQSWIDRHSGEEVDFFDLDTPAEMIDFTNRWPVSHVITVGEWLDAHTHWSLDAACSKCKKVFPVINLIMDSPRGCGGIAITYDEILCEDCQSDKERDEDED